MGHPFSVLRSTATGATFNLADENVSSDRRIGITSLSFPSVQYSGTNGSLTNQIVLYGYRGN